MNVDFNKWCNGIVGLLEPPGCETVFALPPSGINQCCTIGIVYHHRFAFYYWARFARENKVCPPILVTIDSHNDVGCHSDVVPEDLDHLDLRDTTMLGLFSWLRLRRLNDGHILPALYLNFFSDVYVLRKKGDPFSSLNSDLKPIQQKDRNGIIHTVHYFNDEQKLLNKLPQTPKIFLDLDLDYFSALNPKNEDVRAAIQ